MTTDAFDLTQLARQAMFDHGLTPDISPEALQELQSIQHPAQPSSSFQDLRQLLWCSIDNDDSRDLDQLTYAQKESPSQASLWVAVADVDAIVKKGSAIDQQAQINTTSVYTPAIIFPMLPVRLSTNLTSLNEFEERVAIVIKVTVTFEGDIVQSDIFPARVYNHAQLNYNGVGPWLEGTSPAPGKVDGVQGLADNLRLQNTLAQALKQKRMQMGSLSLETIEPVPIWQKATIVGMRSEVHNLAHQLIEHFMISANEAIANHLLEAKMPSLRRVVRVPKDWDRIVELAAELGEQLPMTTDPKALDRFLQKRRKVDPDSFPDLSLSIIKLLGSGEYIVEKPGETPIGHFGLALSEYTHSTAPNRRYPDIISQRQVKASLYKIPSPYHVSELEILANHCTQQEDAATRVERQMRKSAAAVLLSTQIGNTFSGIITGSNEKGIWVRVFDPPVEGKIIRGERKVAVGAHVQVELVSVDIPRGYIDFSLIR